MGRKTHASEPEAIEDIRHRTATLFTPEMHRFLELEAKRLSDKHGKTYTIQDVIRALVASYYEKRMIGLLIEPDD